MTERKTPPAWEGISQLLSYPCDESPTGRVVEFLNARVEAEYPASGKAPEHIATQSYHDGMGFALAVLRVRDVVAVLDELMELRAMRERARAAAAKGRFEPHTLTPVQAAVREILGETDAGPPVALLPASTSWTPRGSATRRG